MRATWSPSKENLFTAHWGFAEVACPPGLSIICMWDEMFALKPSPLFEDLSNLKQTVAGANENLRLSVGVPYYVATCNRTFELRPKNKGWSTGRLPSYQCAPLCPGKVFDLIVDLNRI